MCFSGGASFGAGIILSVAGVTAVSLTKTRSQLFFASIPLFFAVQQVTEGFLWLSLSDLSYKDWYEPSAYVYLVFAHVLWPLWIPLSVLLMEKKPQKKIWLKILLLTGIALSVYLGYLLLTHSMKAQIQNHHIHYDIGMSKGRIGFSSVIYLLPTILSLFIPANTRIRLLGVMILLSFITSWIFFNEFIISVWCFFAAVISVIIVYIISGLRWKKK